MSHKSREQKLVDISFQIAMLIKSNESLQKKSNEELAEWMRNQYEGCGFPMKPIGASWGVLDNDKQ